MAAGGRRPPRGDDLRPVRRVSPGQTESQEAELCSPRTPPPRPEPAAWRLKPAAALRPEAEADGTGGRRSLGSWCRTDVRPRGVLLHAASRTGGRSASREPEVAGVPVSLLESMNRPADVVTDQTSGPWRGGVASEAPQSTCRCSTSEHLWVGGVPAGGRDDSSSESQGEESRPAAAFTS
ncbi:hypothetical protein EYF80_061429 [Liparis tanakae]|uniref:Uncharacterized protein n=1 Tax=Liparis tanakae TaxID=230148 RepID=A0A4Z2EIN3_9TELE|nr:hypothetical protein EYF80_061429 [Liparis tanakae]